MVCLETSFLIDLLRGEGDAQGVMNDIDDRGIRPSVTPVSAAELWVGAAHGTVAERDTAKKLLESLTWLPLTREAARLAGTLRASLLDDGIPVGITDAIIAATAIAHDEMLVTRDEHFQRFPDLRTRSY